MYRSLFKQRGVRSNRDGQKRNFLKEKVDKDKCANISKINAQEDSLQKRIVSVIIMFITNIFKWGYKSILNHHCNIIFFVF